MLGIPVALKFHFAIFVNCSKDLIIMDATISTVRKAASSCSFSASASPRYFL